MARRSSVTSLSLQSDEPAASTRGRGRTVVLLLILLLLVLGGLGVGGYRVFLRLTAMEQQLAQMSVKTDEAAVHARQALDRAAAAEMASQAAAEGRKVAEAISVGARQEAESARQEASTAKETAAKAQAEAEEIRRKARAEVDRLEAALSQVAETRRTALGLVLNLGSDHLKFAFDKAELRPEDKELLSRIAGILITSKDYTISVNGHTDDVGSDAYNKGLSERRAQAVRDYMAASGLSADILSVTGHGKSLPLVRGTSEAARAKNRRVELGIVNTQIRYGR